jgi:cytochrome b561
MPASDVRYTRTAIVLHWTIAVAAAAQVALGWAMQSIPKQPPGLRADAFNLHKSIGLTILLLMALRIAWRIAHAPPPLPSMPAWQRAAAKANHGLLYLVLLALPSTGYLGSAWSGYPVRYFGLALPGWSAKNDILKAAMSDAHLALSLVLAAAVLLHVAAAMHHAWVARDGTLRRMWPGPPECAAMPAARRRGGGSSLQ